jgi:hypothetical protein
LRHKKHSGDASNKEKGKPDRQKTFCQFRMFLSRPVCLPACLPARRLLGRSASFSQVPYCCCCFTKGWSKTPSKLLYTGVNRQLAGLSWYTLKNGQFLAQSYIALIPVGIKGAKDKKNLSKNSVSMFLATLGATCQVPTYQQVGSSASLLQPAPRGTALVAGNVGWYMLQERKVCQSMCEGGKEGRKEEEEGITICSIKKK